MKVDIYSDGAATYTEDSKSSGVGGYSCVLARSGKLFDTASGGVRLTTHNRMEMMGIAKGLHLILTKYNTWNIHTVEVFSDSQYIVNGINEWMNKWKGNGWKLSSKKVVKNKDLWIKLDQLMIKTRKQIRNVKVTWVRGHNGDPFNEMADSLAVTAKDVPTIIDQEFENKN